MPIVGMRARSLPRAVRIAARVVHVAACVVRVAATNLIRQFMRFVLLRDLSAIFPALSLSVLTMLGALRTRATTCYREEPCRKYSKYTVGTGEVRFPVHLWYKSGTTFSLTLVQSWYATGPVSTRVVQILYLGTLVGTQSVHFVGTPSVHSRYGSTVRGQNAVGTVGA